jgi:UDPglucose 6-dehydrogenase
MRIAVIGSGYVGLVTGACLASIGHEVVCTDSDEAKIDLLQKGKLPIFEPGLDRVGAKAMQEGRLDFTVNVAAAVEASDVIFICVGTPPMENGDADLSAIDQVARLIATVASSPKLVVEKSTVPAQTGQRLKQALRVYARNAGPLLRVASNPEFLREGTAVEDFLHPDRIVVGVENESTADDLKEIYRPILEQQFDCPLHEGACPKIARPEWLVTTINSAELIKHASNSFLALKISYANLLAEVCEKLDANVDEVTRAVGLDPRIGPHFLKAGLGFGGFCLPKDVQAFVRMAERVGVNFGLLREVERINKQQIDRMIEKTRHALWVIRGKQIGVLGLAFKPNTDDVRFSPAVELVQRLLAEGARVRAYDPEAMEKARTVLPNVELCEDAYQVANGADALIIATEWPDFRDLNWERVHATMARPLVLDGRNLLQWEVMKSFGLEYESFGRPHLAEETVRSVA